MNPKELKIKILGAGISGLAAAYWLNKEGYDISVFELKNEPGGAMITAHEEGFLIDYGPNSGLETTPFIKQLVDEIGLTEEMIYANEESNKRYILKNNRLYLLPLNPPSFLKTQLFSPKAKLRLLAEPFIGRSADGYYQSISDFVRRRLGQEFLDYAINPFVSGVFAGDPDKLSVKSAFPKLYRLEEVYGGLIKGMIKGARERKKRTETSKQNAKMFSFINGMQSFPRALASKLEGKIFYGSKIEKISKTGQGYKLSFLQNGESKIIPADIIISTLPAHLSTNLFRDIDGGITDHFDNIYYPPVLVLYLGYKKKDIVQPLDGFGFLIPSKEEKSFLGSIWSSTIFPKRSPQDTASFTLFIGGARSPNLLNDNRNDLVKKVLSQFREIMNINVDPMFMREKMWDNAIPQYDVGYIEHEKYFQQFEIANPGLFLSGNYRGGISVGDCIKNSKKVYNRVINFMLN